MGTDTPTFTPVTPTFTSSPGTVVVTFILPDVDEYVISHNSFTKFEVYAWDTAVGTTNGKGIDHVDFWFTYVGVPIPPLPDAGSPQRQGAVRYCAFTGTGTCLTMNGKFGANTYNDLLPGTYTMYVQAYGIVSGDSGVVTITFVK
jgi:hypothetical protein